MTGNSKQYIAGYLLQSRDEKEKMDALSQNQYLIKLKLG